MSNPDWSENQQILYDYGLKCVSLLKSGGAWSTTKPSPLTRDEIVPALEAIASADQYQGQTIIVHDKNMDMVIMEAGKVVESS